MRSSLWFSCCFIHEFTCNHLSHRWDYRWFILVTQELWLSVIVPAIDCTLPTYCQHVLQRSCPRFRWHEFLLLSFIPQYLLCRMFLGLESNELSLISGYSLWSLRPLSAGTWCTSARFQQELPDFIAHLQFLTLNYTPETSRWRLNIQQVIASKTSLHPLLCLQLLAHCRPAASMCSQEVGLNCPQHVKAAFFVACKPKYLCLVVAIITRIDCIHPIPRTRPHPWHR